MTAAYLLVAAVHLAAFLALLPSIFPKEHRVFAYLFGTTFNVSIAELFAMVGLGAFVMGLITMARDAARAYARHRRVEAEPEPVAPAEPEPAPEPAMKVIPPNGHQVDDEPGVRPGPGWRRNLALESAPLAAFASLPRYPSLANFRPWGLDDPARTGAFPTIAHELEVDSEVEPVQLPGFAVDPAARRRLSLSEELIAEVTASLPSTWKHKGTEHREPLEMDGMSPEGQAALIASVVAR